MIRSRRPRIRTIGRAARIAALVAAAAALAGCDKCGDYFWIDGATPHSCKDAPSTR